MVLLHYLVVPGIGDAPSSQSQATAARADEAGPAQRDVLVTAAVAAAAAGTGTAIAETPQAA